MRYLLACCTDAGKTRAQNQDALLLKQAVCGGERAVLAAVCDGMGGLMRGEMASGSLIRAFSEWFECKLPKILDGDFPEQQIIPSWDILFREMNERIRAYGRRHQISIGTTATVILFFRHIYYTAHVGDCRAYEIASEVRQLTKDQTLVQREIERGHLTREEAAKDSRRNVLLQCVGALEDVEPVYGKGTIRRNAVYLICCDGFWRMLGEHELEKVMSPRLAKKEADMERRLSDLVAENRKRGETDNISVLAVRTCKEEAGCWRLGR